MYLKLFILCALVSLVYTFEHKIIISRELRLSECKKFNEVLYKCSNLNHALQLLSTLHNSTDVIFTSGSYPLNVSFTFKHLSNIQLSSDPNSIPAEIKCAPNINGNYGFDTGFAFIGVKNLSIERLNITRCGMKHNSSVLIGMQEKFIVLRSAVFIQNSSDISISNANFFDNNGIGLLIYDTNGTVNIVDSSFTSNKLEAVEQNEYLTGGGGVYIEFTNCTPGVPICYPQSNTYNAYSFYTVDNCRFKDNAALYNFSDSEPDRLASNVHVSFGAGGGLSIQFHGYAHNNSFVVKNSHFDSNDANSGGGLGVDVKQNSIGNSVTVLHSWFFDNSAYMYQGGGGAHMGIAIYQTNEECFFNSYIVSNCTFERNHAIKGVGGGITWYASHEPGKAQATNKFQVHGSIFINNEAQYGSAIQVNKEYHASVVEGSMLTLLIDSCLFTENNLHSIEFTTYDSVGAISASGVNVKFLNFTRFTQNNSTALVVDGAAAEFFVGSYTDFFKNSGLHGGAILLIGDSWIQVHPNSTLLFKDNTALTYGGAIYIELSTPYEFVLSHSCFIRYSYEHTFPNTWDTNFTFISNTANKANNTIFANTLRPCLKSYVEDTCTDVFLYKKPFYYHPKTSQLIMTSPSNILKSKDASFDMIPGKVYDLQVHLIDELCQNITDVMFTASCMERISPYVLPLYTITNGLIQIAGKPKETCRLKLKTDSDYQATKILNIRLLDCPPGFIYSSDAAQCKCLVNETYINPAIKSCDTNLFQAHYNPFYWIGYEPDDAKNLLFGSCPYRYCYTDYAVQNQLLPQNASKAVLDKYVCGSRNRTGLLCGECVEGYSVMMNSPTFACYKCKDHHFGTLFLVLSYFIPVTLLFLMIMRYDIRLTSGPVSAFLFFSQIISSQYHRNFDYFLNANSPATLSASNVLLTIYSISNLEFFQHEEFSYCLFTKAGTVDALGFNALLCLYPIVLIIVYFILRKLQYHGLLCRQCLVCLRLPDNSVTHGICAFLVLSFAKINVTVFTILKSTDISHMDKTTSTFKTVVFMQGNIPYFGNAMYNVYAIGSLLVIVTLIALPTVILMLYCFIANIVIICGWQESKGIQIINKYLLVHKLKPILDSFQGDYKFNVQFFSGLHFFLYKTLFFFIVVAGLTPDIDILCIFIIVFFFLITTLHMLAMPFKKYGDNAAYSLIFMLMLALWTMEYFLLSSDKLSYTIILLWFKIILSSLPLCCFVVYCIYKLLTKFWLFQRARGYESLPDSVNNHGNIDDEDDENQ